jgi:membrane protein
MRNDLERIGKRFVGDVQRDDVAGLAAELAYRFLFAIFPFGIFVAALTAFVAGAIGISDPTGQIIGALGDNLPKDLASGIRPQIEAVIGTSRPGLVTFGAIAALWAATGGTNALIKAMNRAYEVEETRSLVPRSAVAIGLTLLASIGILAAFVTIVGASLLTGQVVSALHLDQKVVDALSLLRWPIVFVFLSVAVGVLYRLAPNFHAPWRWSIAGGAIFSIGWLVATAAFALYVANFANYSNTYGALGGVIVLMLWFYLSALILVAAAALVAAALKELHPAIVAEGRRVAAEKAKPDRAPVGEGVTRLSPATVAPDAAAAAAHSRSVIEHPVRTAAAKRDDALSGPGDWAIAGFAVAIGVAFGTALARFVGDTDRHSG